MCRRAQTKDRPINKRSFKHIKITTDDTVTLAYEIKEKKKRKKTHNNYKLKMDQLTNDRLKISRSHWGRTYLQWLFLNS